MAGRPDTRSTQLFVNYKDNTSLDAMGFAPICKVAQGMEIADKLFGGYDEKVTDKQGQIQSQGNAYLRATWPDLDYVKTATIVGEPLSPERKSAGSAGESKPGSEDSGDKIVLGAVVAILVGGGALLAFTRKKDEPAPKPKSPTKPSEPSEPSDEGSGDEASKEPPAPAPKKKKKPKAD
jgi:hypothetical protein